MQVTVSVNGKTHSLRVMHDARPPQVQDAGGNVTATLDGHFTATITFPEAVYLSVGTGCDPRLHGALPSVLDAHGNGWSVMGTPLSSPEISTAIRTSSVCSRQISDSLYLRREHFASLRPNVDSASLHGEIDASRKTLFIHGRLRKREIRNRTLGHAVPEPDSEEVQIQVLHASLMDAAGNQLLDNVTYSGTMIRQKAQWQSDAMGYASSTTLMAATAVVAASSLTPSSSCKPHAAFPIRKTQWPLQMVLRPSASLRRSDR